ncbi:4Fe-4S dicluster domain-containing protein [Desulfatibacillum aliphaticivorans]|uniref:4Fe-4S ferredoxin iron-sulfur binding domain protein n=1 Tax=Desulfatibacillum aliphaticivorans TaxID=218208 RepID=B8FFF7_DESAL|nr:4Fe-4S dicluster domain-containing protein [Desulfatibacillum aliphaticivorans]ACL04217.1 4Fe-4S ferredoxin iron-sulfur binding domain protein [Desulfatibacillum aliphaticivorans]
MSKYVLLQEAKKCIGCHACEVACKANKELPPGPRLCQVMEVGPRMTGDLARSSHIFMPCYHCEKPWCIPACPTGAMQRRESDGIVYVDESLCVGCKACISACPWGAPQWYKAARKGKVVKCDYCMDRIDQGLQPACVTVCITGCLHFGEANEIEPVRRQHYAKTLAAAELGD